MAISGNQLATPALPAIKPDDLKDKTLGVLNGALATIWRRVIYLSGGSGLVNIPNTVTAQAFQNPSQTQTPDDKAELITLGTALSLFAPGNARAAQLQGAFQTSATDVQQAQPLPQSIASSPAPPATASPGVPGQIAYDASYVYVCVAANTWKRVAISTF